ncbi:hypothetical protein [Okeania sp. KiyG1]|uniref:hypothetical protein n=1 Tax=Okeania sp. KiyG1 TaxID=2720165 RepID=UPI0019217215|nr:hypothetical protein [Okeania sp. KiyG1]GGA02688.1 hypothetical protein CYANOKiyG1_14730 [Okeania sp. KiyG1]
MKIQKMETLLTSSEVESNSIYLQARHDVEEAIKQVELPEESRKFTIYPESVQQLIINNRAVGK